MSSKHYGIEQARKILGDLALEVQRTGQPIILTRGNSRTPIAQITPLENTMTTYIAAVGTASDVVAGDYTDVAVGTADENGNMTDTLVLDPVETTARTDADMEDIQDAADATLEAHGWTRVGAWDIADNALYATVARV
ncbi:hypothetical protein ACOQFV_09145 [Nocardiopsis changdeensis]|uniref:Type II toxin-antitoxin system Phd/YefM family antitoxin n=1 Tax=Nocardiopsis changdeensis TaxID=2831969 RepID=A0ABX8BE29_9ACTN|nr:MULTISPECIES: hypothetical protein [Nocardiopsis]QUX20292.1 hypothetical protein KGD84_17335 [Nocardiopsis changdeensis]QYX36222.1 hypothetical protein K1J57_26790 [Nocardiopsis sp. MT53]